MKSLAYHALLLIGVMGVLEIGSYGAGRLLAIKGVLYIPQQVDDYPRYEKERNPVTGWPKVRVDLDPQRDATGARPTPALPGARHACMSLYGDSFTFGGGVDDEHAWSNVLSRRLGCRVANYGVGGFGTDQALLRFLHNDADRAAVVFLGHQAENILRNVNQLRDLLYPGTPFGLKPRFVPDEDGGLELVPLPRPTEAEFRRLVAQPGGHLSHEFFLPGGAAHVGHLRFPYTLSVLGTFRHFHVVAELKGEPWHASFYEPDHPSRGLEVTARIMERFHDAATRQGRVPVLAVIPTGMDLTYHRDHGRWSYAPLLERLSREGLEVLNIGPGMLERSGDGDPCELLFSKQGCSGHPDERGYALIAEIVHEHLERRGLVPEPLGAAGG